MVAPIFGQPLPNADWPMGGHDARHTGRQTFTPAQGGSPGTLKWVYTSSHPNMRFQASAAVDGSKRIYFTGDQSGTCPLIAIQEVSGQPTLLWEYSVDPDQVTPQSSLSIPALGMLILQEEGGEGASRSSNSEDSIGNPIEVPYGIYWGDDEGYLRCVDSTGAFVWRSVNLGAAISGGPVIASNGHVYVTTDITGNGVGQLCCFDTRASGLNVQPLWTLNLWQGAVGSPAIWERIRRSRSVLLDRGWLPVAGCAVV